MLGTEQPISKQPISKKQIVILVLLGIAALVIIPNIIGRQAQKAPLAQEPKECLPLYGTGKQTYSVLTDNPQNPQIVEVEVDPIDLKQGETQTITVKVKDKGNNTITKQSGVFAKIFLDNKNLAASLKLVKAEDVEENSTKSLLTTWQGFWTQGQENSKCYQYMETITARNSKGEESSVDLSFK